MIEEWKDLLGYEGLYKISNFGFIQSLPKIRIGDHYKVRKRHYKARILQASGPRYLMVVLTKKGVKKTFLVHRLVALTFVTNPLNEKYVNHIDFDTFNNRASNLEWCSQTHNIRHTVKAGRNNPAKGEKTWISKFSDSDIPEIFNLIKHGKTQTQIANIFSVHRQTINKICNRKTYKHVKIA